MKKNKIVLFTLLLSIIGVVGSTKAASVNEESRSFRIENSANSELVQSSSSIDNGKGIRFTNWTSQFQNFKKGDKIKILLPSGKFNGQTTTIRVYVNGKLIGALTLTYGEAYAVIVFNTNANSGDISQFISHFGNFNFGAIGAGGIIDIGGGGTTDGGTINASSSSVVSNSMSSNRNDDNIGGIGSVGSIGGIGSLASIANSTESRSSIEALSSSSSKIISIPASSSSTSKVSSSSSSYDGKGIIIHHPDGGPGPVIINSTMSAWKGSSSQSNAHGTSSSISSIRNSSASSSVISSTKHNGTSYSSVSGSSVKGSSSSLESIDEGKGIHRHSWHISSESEWSSHHHHHHDHSCDGNHHHHHHNSSSSVKKDSSVNGVSQSSNSQSIVSSKSDSYSNENEHNGDESSTKNENSSSKMSQSSASSNVSRESRSDKESVKVIVVPGKESNNSSSSHLSLSKKSSSVNSVKRSVRKASNESSKKTAVKSPANAKNDRRSTKAGSQSVIDQNGRLHLTKQQVLKLQKSTRFDNSKVAKAAREAHRVMNSNNRKVTVHPSAKAIIRNGKITIHREKTGKHSASHIRRVNLPIRGILPATRMDKNTWLYSLIGLFIMIVSGKELFAKNRK